jgi:hypothetical protein
MLKRHTFWLKVAIVFLILTGAIHSLSLFGGLKGETETEKQMIELMTTYHLKLGPYFSPTMSSLFTALSSCFTWLYLFGGVVLIYTMKKDVSNNVLKGIIGICVIFFGISFVVNFILTFIYPIVLTGLCFIFLLFAYLLYPKTAK